MSTKEFVMKNWILAIVGVASTVALGSCGSSKQPPEWSRDYEYQQWLAQKRASDQESRYESDHTGPRREQEYARQPKAVLRESNPVMDYAMEESEHLRSFGSATGYNENAVYDQAIIFAQNRMSVLLESEISSAAKNYVRNASVNFDNKSESDFQELAKRFAINTTKNAPVVKHCIYDLDNGQVKVYVCLEVRQGKRELSKQLANELSREGIMGLEFDSERFAKETEAELRDYRDRLSKSADEGE